MRGREGEFGPAAHLPAVEPRTVDRKLAPVKVAGGDGEPLAPLDGRQPPAGGYQPRGPQMCVRENQSCGSSKRHRFHARQLLLPACGRAQHNASMYTPQKTQCERVGASSQQQRSIRSLAIKWTPAGRARQPRKECRAAGWSAAGHASVSILPRGEWWRGPHLPLCWCTRLSRGHGPMVTLTSLIFVRKMEKYLIGNPMSFPKNSTVNGAEAFSWWNNH